MAMRIRTLIAALGAAILTSGADAQEFLPPSGKGPAAIVASGAMGADAYREAAKRIAAMGYDVFLVDSRPMIGDGGSGLRAAIAKAQASPNATPGKVVMVGFSLGGGQVLGRAPGWGDQVSAVVVFYPLNNAFHDIPGMVARYTAPVLILAGGADHFHDNCCTAAGDQVVVDAAKAAGKTIDIVIYPQAGHDFIIENDRNYDPRASTDAWTRAAAFLHDHQGG